MILTVSIALSYGWGMRGSLIGCERGAALPGALLGMFLALFSGSEIIEKNFYLFAAAGAISMAYGGAHSYGQTIGFIMHRGEADCDPAKGYIGVAVKGGVWHGISGAVLGILFSAAGGKYYTPLSIIIFCVLIPFIQFIGELIFNRPYNKAEKKFPKIYFSTDRREEWGSNTTLFISLLIFALINKDYYSFFFGLTGLIGGAAGFTIGMLIYEFIDRPMKSGKLILGKYNSSLSGWKAMELSFGAITGIFFAVYFVLTKDTMLRERIDLIEATGGIWNPAGDSATVIAWICAALVIAVKLFELPMFKIKSHTLDLIQRPFIFGFPLLLALLGNTFSAKLTAFTLILYFACEKTVFDRIEKFKSKNIRIIVTVIFCIIAISSLITQVLFELPIIAYILMYTIFYIVTNCITTKHYGSSHIVVTAYFLLQTVYLTVFTLINFA